MRGERGEGKRLHSVFFDLETTTTFNVGQILNYCFTLVDADLNPLRELAGRIRISRLQLPAPGAILANRTNVLEHQATTEDTEPVAMKRIADFLWGAVREHQAINLIGYNSSKFDVQYLRTSLARNGLNPYFGGRLSYRDLYHAAKKLAVSEPRFPRAGAARPRTGDEGRMSLSLETLSRAAGLLSGAQQHEAKADVDLTLALARHFRDTFGLDITLFHSYEAFPHHRSPRSGKIVGALNPNYDLSSDGRATVTPMILLEGTDKSVLWVDLERYRAGDGAASLRWMNPAMKCFFCAPSECEWRDFDEVVKAALEEFRSKTLANYFTKTICDIEEHIYRLDPQMMDALGGALQRGNPDTIRECDDAFILYKRHRLAFGEPIVEDEERRLKAERILRAYALHRYGGDMVVVRQRDERNAESACHPTLATMVAELQALQARSESSEDRALLSALASFYERSDIVRVAGAELGFRAPERLAGG